MKLSVFERTTQKKGELNELRRKGSIPAVFYSKGHTPRNLSLSNEEFQALLRNMKAGMLSTSIFELTEGKKKHRAIIKEVQYHPATYAVEHIDFVEVHENVPVTVNVPILVLGTADCAGVKLGGMMRQIIRTLPVTCLPKDIPHELTIDITELNIAQKKRLSDVTIPANVKPLAKMSEVVVVIAKKVA